MLSNPTPSERAAILEKGAPFQIRKINQAGQPVESWHDPDGSMSPCQYFDDVWEIRMKRDITTVGTV